MFHFTYFLQSISTNELITFINGLGSAGEPFTFLRGVNQQKHFVRPIGRNFHVLMTSKLSALNPCQFQSGVLLGRVTS